MCWFLAVDFDKHVATGRTPSFLEIGRRNGVPAALERSRSGNGGHVWFLRGAVARRSSASLAFNRNDGEAP